jgi:adenylate cyclase
MTKDIHPQPLPSGLVTFMFTDIVGSTQMKRKMAGELSSEREAAFVQRIKDPHGDIVAERVKVRGGFIIKSTGDGFMIAFADAEKAVLCAVEIQERLDAAAIFTPDGPLQIRIGLNSGHASPTDGDYTASAVDKAARVESQAGAGKQRR